MNIRPESEAPMFAASVCAAILIGNPSAKSLAAGLGGAAAFSTDAALPVGQLLTRLGSDEEWVRWGAKQIVMKRGRALHDMFAERVESGKLPPSVEGRILELMDAVPPHARSRWDRIVFERLARDRPAAVRVGAAKAAYEVDSPECFRRLLDIAMDDAEDIELRDYCVRAFIRGGRDNAVVVPWMFELLDGDLADAAHHVIASALDAKSLALAIRQFDTHPNRRAYLIESIFRASWESGLDISPARWVTYPMLWDADPDARQVAMHIVVSTQGWDLRSCVVLHLMMYDPNFHVATNAIETLHRSGWATRISKSLALSKISETNEDGVAQAYINALELCECIPHSAVKPLIRWLEREEQGICFHEQALSALIKMGPSAAEALPAVRKQLRSDRERIRKLAEKTVLRLSGPLH